jgi:tellurite resistance protein TerC
MARVAGEAGLSARVDGSKCQVETVFSYGTPGLWLGFGTVVALMLALDLGVFHRRPHAISIAEAARWSAVWIALALSFNGFVWWKLGDQAGLEFLTGYLIEKSLSIDNIFVFVLIFSALRIPAIYQHRVLFWGVLSALLLRALMIAAGVALLNKFHWLVYVFGGFLVFTGIKLVRDTLLSRDEGPTRLLRWVRNLIPTTETLHGGHFIAREGGKLHATPLLLTLVAVELADVVFAVDSIPAVFAVTRDPFIVFTSNVFAILGLRSLFFLVAELVNRLVYLKLGLGAVLAFVGVKMLLSDVLHMHAAISLLVIAGILGIATWASLRHNRVQAERDREAPHTP